jgi:hypothetical protein
VTDESGTGVRELADDEPAPLVAAGRARAATVDVLVIEPVREASLADALDDVRADRLE